MTGKKFLGIRGELWIAPVAPIFFFPLLFIVLIVFGEIPSITEDWQTILWSLLALTIAALIGWTVARYLEWHWSMTEKYLLESFKTSEENFNREHS